MLILNLHIMLFVKLLKQFIRYSKLQIYAKNGHSRIIIFRIFVENKYNTIIIKI